VETHEIVPLTQPEIGEIVINRGTPFSFSATIEVEPVIEPQDYLGMKLEKPDLPVKEEDVQARFEQLREMYSTMEDVKEVRELAEGDFASIDFQGVVDGKSHKGMQADGYLLEIGSHMFIPGFEEQLLGMKIEETREATVTFPGDYHEKNLAGKEAVFTVTLKAIQEKKIPPLDEEFVKNFDRYETLADLRADVVSELDSQNQEKARDQLRTAMIKQLLEKNEFEVPDVLVERQTYYMMADTHRRMSMQGMQPEATAKFIAQLRSYYREEAVQMVKTFLLMKQIAAK
jgi:trigger factor